MQSNKKFQNKLTRYANAFLFVTQTDVDFYDTAPSKLAAAAIFMARAKMGLKDWWLPQLEIITQYNKIELQDVIVRIFDAMKETHPKFHKIMAFDISLQRDATANCYRKIEQGEDLGEEFISVQESQNLMEFQNQFNHGYQNIENFCTSQYIAGKWNSNFDPQSYQQLLNECNNYSEVFNFSSQNNTHYNQNSGNNEQNGVNNCQNYN